MRSVGVARGGNGRERGASLVEFALISPLLFAILLGTITGGLALSTKNSMTNAVREGGRLGVTIPQGANWSSVWAADVRNRVVSVAGGDLTADEVCVQIVDAGTGGVVGSQSGSACATLTPPASPASVTTGCIVKVWARTRASLDTIFFSRSLDLDASAVGRYEREGCP